VLAAAAAELQHMLYLLVVPAVPAALVVEETVDQVLPQRLLALQIQAAVEVAVMAAGVRRALKEIAVPVVPVLSSFATPTHLPFLTLAAA
jgi:predicted methyltransferase MtxX (methanogen marker protein 4)